MGLPDFAHLQSHELNGKECISHSNVTGENRQRDDALLESNDKSRCLDARPLPVRYIM